MLLNMLRKKARSTFIYIIFAAIIVVFIFYFGWGYVLILSFIMIFMSVIQGIIINKLMEVKK